MSSDVELCWCWPFGPLDHISHLSPPYGRIGNRQFPKAEVTPGKPFEAVVANWTDPNPYAGKSMFLALLVARYTPPPRKTVTTLFYPPTDEDLAIVQRLYPKEDAFQPDWLKVEAELVAAGYEPEFLVRRPAIQLIRILERVRQSKASEGPINGNGSDRVRPTSKGKGRKVPPAEEERGKRIYQAWKAGELDRAGLAREFGVDRREVDRAIDREQKREKRATPPSSDRSDRSDRGDRATR